MDTWEEDDPGRRIVLAALEHELKELVELRERSE